MSTVTKSRFFATAFPVILANIAVPIIGLVDTAVIGQLDSAILLAAVGMGAAFLTGIYHLFTFLSSVGTWPYLFLLFYMPYLALIYLLFL